jgi:hypothetical protein
MAKKDKPVCGFNNVYQDNVIAENIEPWFAETKCSFPMITHQYCFFKSTPLILFKEDHVMFDFFF